METLTLNDWVGFDGVPISTVLGVEPETVFAVTAFGGFCIAALTGAVIFGSIVSYLVLRYQALDLGRWRYAFGFSRGKSGTIEEGDIDMVEGTFEDIVDDMRWALADRLEAEFMAAREAEEAKRKAEEKAKAEAEALRIKLRNDAELRLAREKAVKDFCYDVGMTLLALVYVVAEGLGGVIGKIRDATLAAINVAWDGFWLFLQDKLGITELKDQVISLKGDVARLDLDNTILASAIVEKDEVLEKVIKHIKILDAIWRDARTAHLKVVKDLNELQETVVERPVKETYTYKNSLVEWVVSQLIRDEALEMIEKRLMRKSKEVLWIAADSLGLANTKSKSREVTKETLASAIVVNVQKNLQELRA